MMPRGTWRRSLTRLGRLAGSSLLVVAVLGAVLQVVGTDVAGAAGAPVVANGIAAYTPYSLLASGSTMPTSSFQVETLVTGGAASIDPASLTVVSQPASGTATLPTTGFLAWTPTTSTAGSQVVTFGVCATGVTPYSASNASCTTATVTFEAVAAVQPVGENVSLTVDSIPLTVPISENIGFAVVAPTTASQGSTISLVTAPAATFVPASYTGSGITADVLSVSGFTSIIPVPTGLTYVPGSLVQTGGDANTSGKATATYCTAASASCTAQMTGNYKSTFPYIELALPASVVIPGGNNIGMPTVSAQFTASGTVGTVASEKLTEFAVSTSISVPSLSLNFTEVFDGYPTVNTTSPANPPTYLAPIALSSTTITAAKTNQTITYTSTAPAATVGGASYTPTATATSGLAVTFTIDASSTAGACSIAAGVVSFTGAGSCIIDANQAGNGTYNAAPQVQQTVTVGKGSQTVSFTSTAPSSGTVGGATYTPTATASSGLTPAITLDASSTGCTLAAGVVTFTAGGTCVIDGNQAGNANYNAAPQVQQSITVNKAAQTVSFTSTAPAATVGGATYTPTATATSGLTPAITVDASSSTICTITGGVVSFIATGTCTLDANQAGNGSYNAAAQVQQAVTVSKGNQTLTFTSTAPTATVGGASYTPTATSSAGLTVALTLDATSTGCSLTSGVVTFTAVGTCVIDANQAGNANYNPATQVKQTFAVGKGSQTVSFTSTAPAATVGGATYTPTATATSGLTPTITVDASSSSICSITAGAVSFQAAGSCVLDANQAGNANYNAAPQVQQTVTVSKGSRRSASPRPLRPPRSAGPPTPRPPPPPRA